MNLISTRIISGFLFSLQTPTLVNLHRSTALLTRMPQRCVAMPVTPASSGRGYSSQFSSWCSSRILPSMLHKNTPLCCPIGIFHLGNYQRFPSRSGIQFELHLDLHFHTHSEKFEIAGGNCVLRRGRQAVTNSSVTGTRALIMVIKGVIQIVKLISVNHTCFTE